jgi:hypothetical protein
MKTQGKLSAVLCLVLALTLASMAQTAAAPAASQTLAPEERETALKSLQATHDAFLKSIAGIHRWLVGEAMEIQAGTGSLVGGGGIGAHHDL